MDYKFSVYDDRDGGRKALSKETSPVGIIPLPKITTGNDFRDVLRTICVWKKFYNYVFYVGNIPSPIVCKKKLVKIAKILLIRKKSG